MSLIQNAMVPCVHLLADGASDDMGGASVRWREGGRFMAAFARAESKAARRGERDIAVDSYEITVSRDNPLSFHDVFRRVSDGAVFRVTDSGADRQTPASASMAFKQVRAERWALPS